MCRSLDISIWYKPKIYTIHIQKYKILYQHDEKWFFPVPNVCITIIIICFALAIQVNSRDRTSIACATIRNVFGI